MRNCNGDPSYVRPPPPWPPRPARLIAVQWISTQERLPPCAATVLAYVPETGRRLRAFYLRQDCVLSEIPKGWYEDTEYGGQPSIGHAVSHWMELPEGPFGRSDGETIRD